MPHVGFEPTIAVLELAKRVYAQKSASTTVIGRNFSLVQYNYTSVDNYTRHFTKDRANEIS
jgi:hypothetical protein